jgi:pSer/pThr/pTyr-binding forkhead associated (FHA) protein
VRLAPFTADVQLVVDGGIVDEFALAGSSMIIGRSQTCDVAVPPGCEVVSGRHAELRGVAGGGVVLLDLGSSNGTYLGGRPVTRVLLAPDTLHDVQLGQGGASLHLRVSALEPES